MFINLLEFSLQLNGQKFSAHNLMHIFTNNYGWATYSFDQEKKLQLRYYEREGLLKIWGSLPNFTNGQCFYSNHEETIKAITLISNIIDLDISGAIVEKFDFGTVIQTSASPAAVFQNHVSFENYSISRSKNGKSFIDQEMTINFYDAKETLLPGVKKEVQEQWRQKGIYDPSLSAIKFEVYYNDPTLYFEKPVTIAEITDDNFNDLLIADLEDQYFRIEVKGENLIPIEEGYITVKENLFNRSKENDENDALTGEYGEKRRKELMNLIVNWGSIILN